MKTLIRGEKVKLNDFTQLQQLEIELFIDAPFTIDYTCFGLNEERKLADDRYMVFYNQTASPNNEITLQQGVTNTFKVNLSNLPNTVPYLVFTATIDGNGIMSQIRKGSFVIKVSGQPIVSYNFSGNDFQQQRAIIIGEIYFKSLWRIASIGQGFDGGLAALLSSFGGEIAEEETVDTPPIIESAPVVNEKKILLEKKMEREAPHLIDLSKKAQISLEKVGLQHHTAKVALCLDISGSMARLYKQGKVQHFLERILALSTRFDDDGSIDIFLFGKNGYDAGELTISNSKEYLNTLLKTYPLEGSTYYSKAITLIRKHYIGSSSHRKKPAPLDIPVYVMFVTDGDTFDRDQTTKQMVNASFEPIFWQFMAIDEQRSDLFGIARQSQFQYLEKLDTLEGRFIDNAGFFSVKDPAQVPDEELYDLLMGEYPQWVKEAKAKGLLLG